MSSRMIYLTNPHKRGLNTFACEVVALINKTDGDVSTQVATLFSTDGSVTVRVEPTGTDDTIDATMDFLAEEFGVGNELVLASLVLSALATRIEPETTSYRELFAEGDPVLMELAPEDAA